MKNSTYKKLMTLGITFATALTLAACSTQIASNNSSSNATETKKVENSAEVTDFTNISKASFYVSKNGQILPSSTEIKDTDVIDWYIDPYCPSCILLDTIMEERIPDLTDKMVIRFHPLSFLSPRSVDDYSNRAAGYLLGVAEYAPEKYLEFMHSIMNEEFHPGVGNETSDEKFKKAAKDVGVTDEQWTQIEKAHSSLIAQVKEETAIAFNDKELTAKAVSGKLTVPFVVIGDSKKALDFTEAYDAESYFIKEFEKYTTDKKIDSNKYTSDSNSEEKSEDVSEEETDKE